MRTVEGDIGGMQKQTSVEFSKVAHALCDDGFMTSQCNLLDKSSALAVSLGGVTWEHLMKLQAKLASIITLVQKNGASLPMPEPIRDLCCMVCGFKLEAQHPAIVAHRVASSGGQIEVGSGLGSGLGRQGVGLLEVDRGPLVVKDPVIHIN